MSGIGSWTRQLFPPDGRCYFGGRFFDNWLELGAGGITPRRDPGVVIIPTHAGTHIVQRYYRGPNVSATASRRAFSTGFIKDSEADFVAFERIQARGEAVTFFPGLWESELFRATSGEEYTLRRTPALGVVPGLEEEDFPIEVYLDGVLDPAAADVTGRTVSANDTGEIEIVYAPLYLVVITSQQEQVEDAVTVIQSLELAEVIITEGA